MSKPLKSLVNIVSVFSTADTLTLCICMFDFGVSDVFKVDVNEMSASVCNIMACKLFVFDLINGSQVACVAFSVFSSQIN